MIFVTVGNAKQGFRRLLDAVDRLVGQGAFGSETVFIQSGNNPDFRLSNCKHEPFLSMEEYESKIHEADLIISHTGAGMLLHAFQAGKIPVVMPRQKKYGEHVDDHQIELVKALAAEGRIIPAYEPEDLPGSIKMALEVTGRRKEAGASSNEMKSPMFELVGKAIEEMMRGKM